MEQSSITIGIVDPHVLFRKGIINLLNQQSHYQVTLEAGNGYQLQNMLKQEVTPEILLMELHLPGMTGYRTLEWLHQNYPDVKVIILTGCDYEATLSSLIQNGARAFLKKSISPEELIASLQAVYEHGWHYTDCLTRKLLTNAYRFPHLGKSKPTPNLSLRELQFLQLAASDRTYQQIADEMGLSFRSIDKLRDTLFFKLDVKSRVGLSVVALRHGLTAA